MSTPELTADAIDDLKIALPKGKVMRVGPSVSLYHSRKRDAQVGEQVATVLEMFLDLAREDIAFIKIDAGPWEPAERSDLATLPDRIRNAESKRPLFLALHGGENAQDAHPVFFSCMLPAGWNPEPLTYVSAGFSMKLLMETKAKLTTWTQAACSAFQPAHGSGGFALLTNLSWGYTSVVIGQVASALDRFPGLDHPALPTGIFVTREGPVCANWITILDDTLIAKISSPGALSADMTSMGGQALRWKGGLALVAPGAPQIGDAEADKFPETYKGVGAIIAGVRGAKDAVYFPGGSERDMIKFGSDWRARFD